MAEQYAFGLWMIFNQRFDQESDVEAGALPRDVDHLIAIDFFAEALLIDRGGNSNDRVRMQMISVLVGNQRVQGRINRTGARVEIEDAMAVHRVQLIFDLRLRPAF